MELNGFAEKELPRKFASDKYQLLLLVDKYQTGFDQIYEELIFDDSLGLLAKSNTIENFKFGFEDKFMDTTISRMEQNQDIFTKMMNDKEFGNIVRDYMLKKVYQQLRK